MRVVRPLSLVCTALRPSRRRAVSLASCAAIASAVVHAAIAQQPAHRGARGRARPAADAGPAESAGAAGAEEAAGREGFVGPGGLGDAGTAAPPIAHIDLADGGIKPSPLNPAAAELPPQVSPPLPDYDKLLGDVSALRARVAAVTDSLFRSRIAISLEADGSHAKIARLVVSLDDGVVFTSAPGASFDSRTALYDHGVAPGRHAVTVDVDRKDDRDDTFRTAQRSRFLVDVPRDERLEVQVRIDDDSTMGGDFPSDHSGRYDLRVRAKAAAKPVK